MYDLMSLAFSIVVKVSFGSYRLAITKSRKSKDVDSIQIGFAANLVEAKSHASPKTAHSFLVPC
jgi:hypothetical protein